MERTTLVATIVALSAGCITGYLAGNWDPPANSPGIHLSALPQLPPVQPVPEISPDALATGTAESSQPSGTLEKILSDTLESRRRHALDRYCANLDAAGIRSAIESLTDDGSDETNEALFALMCRWTELEPAAAAQFALNSPDKQFRTGALINVLEAWVHLDAKAAEQFVLGMSNPGLLSETLHYFASALAEHDPAHALRFADAVPLSLKTQVLWAAFRSMAENNPSAAVMQASQMPAGQLQEQSILAAVSVWVAKDPLAALAWVERQTGPNRDRLMEDAVRYWQETNPEAAASYVQKLPPGSQRENLIPQFAADWSFRDVASAMTWVQKLPDDPVKMRALEKVISSWAMTDPLGAADLIAKQPAGQSKTTMLEQLGATWPQNDPEGALEWSLAHTSAEVEQHVMTAALGRVAAEDPARAVAALEHLKSPEARSQTLRAIASNWIRKDPQEAMRWAMSLPDSKIATDAIERWSSRDPGAVGSWLNTLEPGERRDSFVSSYTWRLQFYDAEAAATWANTMADANARQPLVRSIVKTMAQYDPDAAARWIQAQSFDAAERKALLEQMKAETQAK